MLIEARNLSRFYRVNIPGEGAFNKIKNLIRPKYKTIKAIDDISFDVCEGDIVGYLGPNGAGKSTTIKLLTGVLVPTSGSIRIDGVTPDKDRKKNAYNIGVVFGQRSQLWWDLPLIDSYKILATIYRIPRNLYNTNLCELVELLDMGSFIDQPVRKLSLGQKMRGDIAAALLHDPRILYLDEPTIGLDIVSKNKILDYLSKIRETKRKTIIYTTHNLSDVERLCNRIMIINKGKMILDSTNKSILNHFGKKKIIIIEFEDVIKIKNIPFGKVIREEVNKVWIEIDRDEANVFDLIKSFEKSMGIIDISIEEESIESIITKIYMNEVED